MWNDSVVTDGGMTILSQWAGGGSTLDITAAKLGGGTVPAVQLVRQTNVTGYKGTADIIQHKDIDGGVQFTIRISPLDTAAVIKQIGIFGKLNGGDEKLIAIYQDNDGIPVPGSEMPEFAYDFNATIAADRGSDMTVNVDPMAFATKVELASTNDALSVVSENVNTLQYDLNERTNLTIHSMAELFTHSKVGMSLVFNVAPEFIDELGIGTGTSGMTCSGTFTAGNVFRGSFIGTGTKAYAAYLSDSEVSVHQIAIADDNSTMSAVMGSAWYSGFISAYNNCNSYSELNFSSSNGYEGRFVGYKHGSNALAEGIVMARSTLYFAWRNTSDGNWYMRKI